MYLQKLSLFLSLFIATGFAKLAVATDHDNGLGDGQDWHSMSIAAIDLALEKENPGYEKFIVEDAIERGQQGRDLEGLGRQENERCGNNSPCAPGLECVSVLLGKRCKPVNCLEKAITSLEQTFDTAAYKETILTSAGYTEDSFLVEAQGFGSALSVVGRGPLAAIGDALKANPPPHAELRAHIDACRANTTALDTEQSTGSTTTLGFMFEIGAIATFSVSIVTANGDNDDNSIVLQRLCGGGGGRGGIGFNFVYGLHSTPSAADLACASVMTIAGVMAGIGGSIANVCTLRNTTIDGLEVLAGLGAGGGVGVAGCCTTQQ